MVNWTRLQFAKASVEKGEHQGLQDPYEDSRVNTQLKKDKNTLVQEHPSLFLLKKYPAYHINL